MTMFGSQWFANPGVTYEIDQSCRFNSADSAYTGAASPTPTSERIFTFSFWVKRGKLGTAQTIWSNDRGDGAGYGELSFLADNKLRWKAENTGGANIFDRQTNAVFRDPSAWYHVVCVVDSNQTDSTAADIYVNGVVQTYSTTTNPGSAQDLGWPTTSQPFEVGRLSNGTNYLDAYLAEFYFVDGQKLAPSSFGETNSTTGQWVPKAYTGTFGNAGLFLDFSVAPGTGDGAGTDSSGNDNDLADSGLAAADQMPDSPTDNDCTLNPLNKHANVTLSNGNLYATSSSNWAFVGSTIAIPPTGKFVFEAARTSGTNFYVGIINAAAATGLDVGTGDWCMIQVGSGTIDRRIAPAAASTLTTVTAPGASIIRIEYDVDTDTIEFFDDGASVYSTTMGIDGSAALYFTIVPYTSAVGYATFSENDFVGTPTSDFKGLSTSNFSDPTIADPSGSFQTTLYTGDGASSLAVNQGGNSTFDPDFVWIKNRDATDGHCLFDSVRGATKLISSDSTAAETTDADTLLSFDSDGFSVGADVKVNTNTEKYVGWQWIEGATPGFDIVSFTGNATGRTISHSVGVAPEFMVVKNLADTDNWAVYHTSNTTAPATDYLILNTTAATADDATIWNDTVPTSSVFSVGTSSLTNGNTEAMIAYLFAGVEGFSKFGSYTGNGNADGPFVWCGFTPSFILTKNIDTADQWGIRDAARNPFNVTDKLLNPNAATAETSSSTGYIDILSNGFKPRSADSNINTQTIIYAAFAETPFKTATAR